MSFFLEQLWFGFKEGHAWGFLSEPVNASLHYSLKFIS